ncbi:MAG: hypothetical protein ABIJ86_00480, partial [Spirochaetota bacterium]
MKIRPATIKAIATLAASFVIFSCAGIPEPSQVPPPVDILPGTVLPEIPALQPELPEIPEVPEIVEPPAPPELTEEEKEAIELAEIQRLIGQGELAEAASRFGVLAEVRPDNREYPVLRASLLLSVGELDKARAAIKEEMETYPDNLRALFILGQIERFSGNQRAFQASIENIIKQDPGNPEANASM